MNSKEGKCCDMMEYQSGFKCNHHRDKYACPDTLIDFNEKSNSYSLITHDGGSSGIRINFCPWCSRELSPK